MPDPGIENEASLPLREHAPDLVSELNRNLVMVATSSNINAVVVSRIIERTGLKALSTTPAEALRAYEAQMPGTVILDGGSDNLECGEILQTLVANRRRGVPGPALVFLSTKLMREDEEAAFGPPDAVIAKPITCEALQPMLWDLSAQHLR